MRNVWERYFDAGNSALERGNSKVACKKLGQALKESEGLGPEYCLSTILIYERALESEGRADERERILLRGMQLAQDLEGHHSVAFALTANNLGMIFRNRGDVEQAQPLLERAVEALERNPDEPDAGCAVPYKNLAKLYCETGRLADAERLLMRAYEIQETWLEDNDDALTDTIWALSKICQANGKPAEATKFKNKLAAVYPSMANMFGEDRTYSFADNILGGMQQLVSTKPSKAGPSKDVFAMQIEDGLLEFLFEGEKHSVKADLNAKQIVDALTVLVQAFEKDQKPGRALGNAPRRSNRRTAVKSR